MEEYFDWYDMDDDRRVRFARVKLVGLAKFWWTGAGGDIRRMGCLPISTWQEIKATFGELKTRSQIFEDPRHNLARFKSGLRYGIRRKLLQQPIYSLEQVFQISMWRI